MDDQTLFEQLHEGIARYDLLCHPFYKAWSAGELTAQDLREYSAQYYHHVAAFPTYLSAFHSRLTDGGLRRAVLRNLFEEEIDGISHSDLWLDFAEAMGNRREDVKRGEPIGAVKELIAAFDRIARTESAAGVLAAFYAYESQVPAIAKFKSGALRQLYGASDRSCRYFVLHESMDVDHARTWSEYLKQALRSGPRASGDALAMAQHAAGMLWKALDGMEERRTARR
jgi:pyrroloquinoline-quinone synthase